MRLLVGDGRVALCAGLTDRQFSQHLFDLAVFLNEVIEHVPVCSSGCGSGNRRIAPRDVMRNFAPGEQARSFRDDGVGHDLTMKYNDMMRTVAGATGLTRKQADQALIVTLTVLAETISAEETRDLLAQLPKTVRERIPVSSEKLTMRPIEFVARVADLGVASIDDAERNIRTVFGVLTEAVNAGEMNDMAAELGDEFADLLGRSERVERERAANSANHSLVATLTGAARFVVSSAARVVRRPIDIGLRLSGLKH